jgi:hypothetical protein
MAKYFRYFPKIEYGGETVTDITRRVKVAEKLQADPYLFLPYTVTSDDRPEDIARLYYGDVNKVWMIYLANNIIDPYTQWPLSNEKFESTIRKKYAHSISFAGDKVNVSSNRITSTMHGFKTTDPVIYTGSLAIGGLTSGTTYYVIRVNSNIIKLATSATNARNGTAINITTTTNSTVTHTLSLNVDTFLSSTLIDTNVVYCTKNTDTTIKISYDTYRLGDVTVGDWTPVRVYEYETQLNEDRRTIFLINADYAQRVEKDLKSLLNG